LNFKVNHIKLHNYPSLIMIIFKILNFHNSDVSPCCKYC